MINLRCRVCENAKSNRDFYVREMMFGYREVFRYFQCLNCGCLQIKDFPKNMSKYYPPNYYSLSSVKTNSTKSGNPQRRYLQIKRNEAAILNRGIIGRLLCQVFPMDKDWISTIYQLLDFKQLANRRLSFKTRILDVGCGNGSLLCALQSIGFRNLLGVDPFIKNEIFYNKGVRILKGWLNDIDEVFDLIMFHHSFEHIPDPLDTLNSVYGSLSKTGLCIIRIPTVSSYAWQKYGTNWVQLDAPRHLFLHSIKSMKLLFKKAGLKLENVVYDSTDFQFWGSEQYLQDISLLSDASYMIDPSNSIFSSDEIEYFRYMAKYLNHRKLGDQAVFYVSKEE